MTIHLNIPEDIAQKLTVHGEDLTRLAVESLALEGYRSRALSEEQIRRLIFTLSLLPTPTESDVSKQLKIETGNLFAPHHI